MGPRSMGARVLPIAVPRSLGWNTSDIIACDDIIVAPTMKPCTARSAMRILMSDAKMIAIVNASYIPNEMNSIGNRPNLSLKTPQTSWLRPTVPKYMDTDKDVRESVVERSVVIDLSAGK